MPRSCRPACLTGSRPAAAPPCSRSTPAPRRAAPWCCADHRAGLPALSRVMRRFRRLAVAIGIGAVLGAAMLLPGAGLLQRQGIDLLLWLDRPLGWTRQPLPERPPVVVVAIREE